MSHNAVGFYWTLPVPWVGFTSALEAADGRRQARSCTIRYQRDSDTASTRRCGSLPASPRGRCFWRCIRIAPATRCLNPCERSKSYVKRKTQCY